MSWRIVRDAYSFIEKRWRIREIGGFSACLIMFLHYPKITHIFGRIPSRPKPQAPRQELESGGAKTYSAPPLDFPYKYHKKNIF